MDRGRLISAMRLDVRLQARSQLYRIGLGVAVVLGLLIRFLLPEAVRGPALAAFFFLAIGGTTFMFSAVMLLWDRSENTLAALRVSPMDASTYIVSKTVTLSTFALVEAAVVYVVGGGWGVPVGPLVLGVMALGVLYTLVGLAQVAPHDSVTAFVMPGGVVTTLILQLPVFYLFDIGPPILWHVIPSMPALLLMRAADLDLAPGQWGYVGVGTAAAIGGAWQLATWRLRRHAGLR